MLILTRRLGETIVIGDEEINITVLGVKGNQVRIGVNAPSTVAVHRKEIFDKIQREKLNSLLEQQGSDGRGNAAKSNNDSNDDVNDSKGNY